MIDSEERRLARDRARLRTGAGSATETILMVFLAVGTGVTMSGPFAIEGSHLRALGLWAPPTWMGLSWGGVGLAVYFSCRGRWGILAAIAGLLIMTMG